MDQWINGSMEGGMDGGESVGKAEYFNESKTYRFPKYGLTNSLTLSPFAFISLSTNNQHTTELERSRTNNLGLERIDVDPKYIVNVQQIEEELTHHCAKGQ